GAAGSRAGALAAADRLVVREAVVPEGEVVHRALALSWDLERLPERGEDDVDDPARGLDVARGDGRRRAGVDETALRGQNPNGDERPAGGRHVGVGDAANDEVAGRTRDGEGAVEVAVVLWRRAGEVDLELAPGDGDGG